MDAKDSTPSPRSLEQPSCQEDWGEAPDVGAFFGRDDERAVLRRWIIADRCRLVGLLGIGGIGKTTLALKLAAEVKEHFQAVLWRSLLHAPLVGELLADVLKVL